jgi:predicted short-subunit dehydrogenase-like oxidoreductase (DUF2520 family)
MNERMIRAVVFGPGRMGRAFAGHLRALGHGCELVTRAMSNDERERVAALIAGADVVAAALPDDRLAHWHAAWKDVVGKRPAIHFSGAVAVPGMRGYHPLYSFGREDVSFEVFRRILIARETGAPPLRSLLPRIVNPEIEIAAGDRALYHALAVVSGNFTAHVWNEATKAYAGRFTGVPADALALYFSSLVDRFRDNPTGSYTGPVARRDAGTVGLNLKALESDPALHSFYRAFLASAWPEYEEKG